jgi:hypothetical protein
MLDFGSHPIGPTSLQRRRNADPHLIPERIKAHGKRR